MKRLLARLNRLARSRPKQELPRSPEEHAALCAELGVTPDWLVVGGGKGGYVLFPPEEEP